MTGILVLAVFRRRTRPVQSGVWRLGKTLGGSRLFLLFTRRCPTRGHRSKPGVRQQSCQRRAHLSCERLTCHAGLHQSVRRPLRVMRRGFLLSSRRSATRISDSATWPGNRRETLRLYRLAALMGFTRPSQVCSHPQVAPAFPPKPGPPVVRPPIRRRPFSPVDRSSNRSCHAEVRRAISK